MRPAGLLHAQSVPGPPGWPWDSEWCLPASEKHPRALVLTGPGQPAGASHKLTGVNGGHHMVTSMLQRVLEIAKWSQAGHSSHMP